MRENESGESASNCTQKGGALWGLLFEGRAVRPANGNPRVGSYLFLKTTWLCPAVGTVESRDSSFRVLSRVDQMVLGSWLL